MSDCVLFITPNSSLLIKRLKGKSALMFEADIIKFAKRSLISVIKFLEVICSL